MNGVGTGGADADTVRCLAPASAALTNFSIGTTYSDQIGVESFATAYPGSLMLAASGDTVQLSGTVNAFSNLEVGFAACVDASAYSGISFELGGNVGATGMVTLGISTRDNNPEPPFTATGTCVPKDPSNPFTDCHPGYLDLPVAPAPTSTTVRFADVRGGVPTPAGDPAQLLSLGFSLFWSSGAQPYDVNLTLGNVSLIH